MIKLFKLSLLLGFLVLSCSRAWADDFSANVFYTQYAYGGIGPSVGTIYLDYVFSSNSLSLSDNTVLVSSSTNPNFGGADGIVINPNDNDLLIAGGGGPGIAGIIYQVTQAGAEGNPFEVSMTPGTTSYTETLVPANGTKSGFPAGELIATEKDFGYGRISIFSISPALAAGTYVSATGV